MTWLDKILTGTDKLESPKRYWLWSSLAAVSAVLKDKVYIDRQIYKLYPNIYVILYGPSGIRKGPPIALAKDLVMGVGNTRVISGRSSIEAIIQELSTAVTVPGKGIVADSSGFIVSSEFSSSIIHNPAAITILTDLYDRIYNTGEWKNLLKGGSEKLRKPTVTLLGGANEAQFKDIITARDTEGGFLGRTFLISETKKHRVNSLMDKIDDLYILDELVDYLKEVSKLQGEVTLLPDAKRFYKEWYDDTFSEEVEDTTGTALRLGDMVLKIAILVAVSIAPELMISRKIIETSIALAKPLLPSAQKTTMGKGKSGLAEQTAKVIMALLEAETHSLSREYILRKLWHDLDAIDLDRIIITLEGSGAVISHAQEKGKMYYTMKPEAVEQFEKMEFKKRKKRA